MMKMKRRLACCTRDRELSIDFDEHHQRDGMMTYEGLESCILNSHSCGNESGMSGEDECATDSLEDDATSCSSSNAFVSFVSQWMKEDQEAVTWDGQERHRNFHTMEKSAYVIELSDAKSMKENFSKLLLGEDDTGGAKGLSPALALSNAITNLATSVFGELWKLEPLPEERKNRWRKEMDWFLSPANYMVELVPAKQSGSNGRTFEIMTPKARADVHMTLPALQKLDTMLIETLDSMVKTEFWYSERSTHHKDERREGSEKQGKRWWLPYPRVPTRGLSEIARKKLISRGNVVLQVFKASKSINQNILSEMQVLRVVKDALPKSGRASLGEELYSILAEESSSAIDMADSLKLKSDHQALDTINKLESAQMVWRDKVIEQASEKPPVRKSWPFVKDSSSKVDKIEFLLYRVETLLRELRMRYPHLPLTFLDMTKIQYSKDVGHLIMEAYSRVLANLAYNILLRIGDILQEDRLSNPTSPFSMCCFPGTLLSPKWMVRGSPGPQQRARRSLVDQMSKADSHSYFSDSNPSRRSSDLDISSSDARCSSVVATPSASQIWCVGGDGCSNGTPCSSP